MVVFQQTVPTAYAASWWTSMRGRREGIRWGVLSVLSMLTAPDQVDLVAMQTARLRRPPTHLRGRSGHAHDQAGANSFKPGSPAKLA
jgi:hypothetical protein